MTRTSSESGSVKRLAVIAPDATSLLRQRAELLADVMARRHSVLALVPETSDRGLEDLAARGISVARFPMRASEPQLLADGKSVAAITAALIDWRAHVVLATGAKPLLLGAMAARKAAISRRVGLVTALPPAMAIDASAAPSWRWRRMVKTGFAGLDTVVFHNDSDRDRFRRLGLLPAASIVATVAGAGVDLARHAAQTLPPLVDKDGTALNFLMLARKDAVKGAAEFCEAARLVRAKAPDTRFILAGPEGDIDAQKLAGYATTVQVLGDQADVRPLIGAAHVVVVPSWSEGMPRVLLEALSAGRPVIASDIPGCREAVDERVNGVLVPPRNAASLAEAMLSYLKRPDLIPAMARASRTKAERRFDVRVVNATLLDALGL